MLYRVLGLLSIFMIGLMIGLIFLWAPSESSMGITQKIMYIHVPSIITTYLALMIAFICSVLYLWKRKEILDIIAFSAMELGAIFCGLALATGAIWGKPTWNTYWTWDARLTLTLVLFLIFCGYLLLRKFTDPGEQQARICAIIAIIGTLDIPLIHLSVVWWRTLHQTSTILSTKKQAIDKPLLLMLIFSIFSLFVFFTYLMSVRIKLEKQNRDYAKQVANLY